ncbi:TlpA disulfide reductase family protein [Pedobacter sp.]|jgi:thiol-disulfide isomerase/thioredoxin|uniref:TlpA family protein disulfide reductase n=1 Tax=Pedobacter sp. TaxID=1411316 RepID=UPI002B935B81|nr:TlpA disulfide reductase family protein [Pedobacter sp.]HWW40150.1 TlpA disulfide reductase family protein [Pedobacter sp.]
MAIKLINTHTLLLAFNLLVYCSKANPKSFIRTDSTIHIKILYKEATKQDTLTISIGQNMLTTLARNGDGDRRQKYKAVQNERGYYQFEIPVHQSCGYFDLSKNRTTQDESTLYNMVPIMDPQFWELGDSITINLKFTESILGGGAVCTFYGRGSAKYNLCNDLYHFNLQLKTPIKVSEIWPPGWDGNILEYENFDSIPTIISAKLKVLDSRKDSLTNESYNVIKANLLYSSKGAWFSQILNFGRNGKLKKLNNKTQQAFLNRFNSSFDASNNYKIEDKYLINSIDFLYFLQKRFQASSVLNTGKYSPEWIYNALKKYPISNEIKETLIMREFAHSAVFAHNLGQIYDDAQTIIKNKQYLGLLKEFRSRVPGQTFTDFSLKDLNDSIKTLSNYKNKVILIDFWFTGCGHCEDYYRDILSKVEQKLQKNPKVIFLSISIDKSKIVWKQSVEKGIYTSKDAENLYTNGQMDQHPIIRINNIPGYPFLILLDKDSKIKSFNSADLHEEKSLTKSIMDLL